MDFKVLKPKNIEINSKNIKIKNVKLSFKQKWKTLKDYIKNINVDFVFIFLITIAFVNWTWWARIGFAIGSMALYKLIIKDVFKITIIKAGKK